MESGAGGEEMAKMGNNGRRTREGEWEGRGRGMLDARREAGMTRFLFIQDKDPRYSSFCLKGYLGRTQLNSKMSLVTSL